MRRLADVLRSPTAKVLDVCLPYLIELDGLNRPAQLNFEFDVTWIETPVLEAALLIVEDERRLVYREGPGVAGEGAPETFYILSTTNPAWVGGQMTPSLVKRCAVLQPAVPPVVQLAAHTDNSAAQLQSTAIQGRVFLFIT